jgi:hypothetical protein
VLIIILSLLGVLFHDAYTQIPYNNLSLLQNVYNQIFGNEKGMIFLLVELPFVVSILLFNIGFYLRNKYAEK